MAELGRLERLYGSLHPVIQSAVFSAWGLRTRWLRHGGEFRAVLAELEQSDFESETAIAERRRAALRRVVHHAFRTVPFYRELAARLSIDADDVTTVESLRALPVLDKSAVRADPLRFVSEDFSPNSLLHNRTSGTTGSPMVVYHTRRALRFQWAVWWRHKARFNVRLGDPFLTFGARVPALGRLGNPWRENLAMNQTYLVSSLLVGAALDDAIDMVRRRRFTFYTGYPSAMYVLARAILERGLTLEHPPRMVFTGSDALTPGFRAVIEQAFGAPVSDNFGSAEMCGNLSQCPQGRYHVDHELGIVELLPVPGSADHTIRKLVCTGLVNDAMPLVRYDLGDYARVAEEPCTCGRSSPSVLSIDGRMEDLVRTPDGRVISGLNQVLEWVPGVIEAQVRQDELAAIDVLFVTNGPITEEQESVLLREVRKRAGDSLKVRTRRVDHIPRMSNGKFRAVVSTLAPADGVEAALQDSVRGEGADTPLR